MDRGIKTFLYVNHEEVIINSISTIGFNALSYFTIQLEMLKVQEIIKVVLIVLVKVY